MQEIDWDVKLIRAQAGIDLGMTDAEIRMALDKCLELAIALGKALAEVWADFIAALRPICDDLSALGFSLKCVGCERVKSDPKAMWKTPRAQKRPPLFVAYNQIPQKRPLKGRRGRH